MGEKLERAVAPIILATSFLPVAGFVYVMLFVVPRFERIFADFHTTLPATLEAVFEVRLLLHDYWFVILPMVLTVYGVAFALVWTRRLCWSVAGAALAVGVGAVLGVQNVMTALLGLLLDLIRSVRQ